MIDLAVSGDPAGCRGRAKALVGVADTLDDLHHRIGVSSRDSEAEWEGDAAV